MPAKPRPIPLPPEGYSWPELYRLVGTTLRTGLSVLLRGHPGVGKSTLAQALATDFGLPLIDIRLAQRDPSDLCGVWFPDKDSRSLIAYPPAWAQRAAAEPCLVFLDEINAAVTKLHQAAAYQIVLEKRVGDVHFHPGTVVLAAGNLEDDNAIVSSLSSALCNRFAHFIMKVDPPAWLEWGARVGVDASVLAYIGHHGADALYDQSGHDLAFPSPRSWEMASRLMQAGNEDDVKRLVSACIGPAAAQRFFTWRRLFARVNVRKILHNGEMPTFTGTQAEPSFVYAATFAVAGALRAGEVVSDDALPNIVRLLRLPGLDPEYAFLFLRHIHPNEALTVRLRALPAFRALAGELAGAQLEIYR